MDVIKTVVAEHQGDEEQISRILNASKGEPPAFAADSPLLSVVRFTCMLQDTSYSNEVYQSPSGELAERWIGWAVDRTGSAPDQARSKYPPSSFVGALIKIYDDVAYKPGSVHTFIGIVSTAPLPDSDVWVPAIHVLSAEQDAPVQVATRDKVLGHLYRLCQDRTAATLLLLLLISSPTRSRSELLGSLCLNFFTGDPQRLQEALDHFLPVVYFPLTLDVLRTAIFWPKSDSTSLEAGLLQLADGSVLIVDERQLEEGDLHDKAMKNLQVLSDCISEQKLRYEYPYMDGLKIDCNLKTIIVSDAKSLLPTDFHVKVDFVTTPPPSGDIIAYVRQPRSHFHIPDRVSQLIQESFVTLRRDQPKTAENVFKRRMKLARLMALSYDGELSESVWKESLQIDQACS